MTIPAKWLEGDDSIRFETPYQANRPRRFNPANAAWLPVLHTDRTGRHYTAFYSNTAKAHDLNTIHDWVVIFRDDTDAHDRWTVITS